MFFIFHLWIGFKGELMIGCKISEFGAEMQIREAKAGRRGGRGRKDGAEALTAFKIIDREGGKERERDKSRRLLSR